MSLFFFCYKNRFDHIFSYLLKFKHRSILIFVYDAAEEITVIFIKKYNVHCGVAFFTITRERVFHFFTFTELSPPYFIFGVNSKSIRISHSL